ncbi:MAG: flavodoxin domain-containing protein [Rhodospirillales bacterium]|nr:flavodoxin domain-containing protein [Rhodospirillales bacterium]
MSIALAEPPFAAEELAPLGALLARATAGQRRWLAGYVAGFDAALAAPTAAPAAPAAPPRPKLTILYATESGNAESIAAALRRDATRRGFAVRLRDAADTLPGELSDAGTLLVVASTWGDGEAPQRAAGFVTALEAADAPSLAGLRFAVLALGDRAYARFCATGRLIDARLAALGAERLAPLAECDVDFASPAATWSAARLSALATADAAPSDAASDRVIHVDFAGAATASRQAPAGVAVSELINLNSSRSDRRTWHVELDLAGIGLAYEPGDAIGVWPRNAPALVEAVLAAAGVPAEADLTESLASRYDLTTVTVPQVETIAQLSADSSLAALAADARAFAAWRADRQLVDLLALADRKLTAAQLVSLLRPLAPRLYSVASSRKLVGDAAHLLVAEVAWESHGRARRGVASGMLADTRPGEEVRVFVQPNRHFRLPGEAGRPVIMIGPGTGVAPFRGFLQEMEATGEKRPSWLFFGARRFHHDFLYQTEWQDWLRSGLLTRLDLAFSRDQPERVYVQHRIWESREALSGWIRDCASIYVCGDAAGMAKDVHAMLARILGADGDEQLSALARSGRYQRDVY